MPYNCGPSKPKRLGQVIVLKEECVEEYCRVHADSFPGVRDLLQKHNLHNFSIFMQVVSGQRLLFLYGEYTGDNFDADMAALSSEPRDIEWHKLCDPMQTSLNLSGGWLPMECVYYNR
jgi:L-rhamnose mutarotase